ncbi:MAG: hypothetical protein WBD95_22700 [Xanthobacteraceae bacterium]
MPEQIFDPIPITYRGLIADSHLVDAQQFGRSLIGISKLANSVCHELLFDQVTHDPRSYHVRFCVVPSRENGLLQEIVAVVVTGMPLFSPIAMEIGKVFVEQMIKAMISNVLQKQSDMSKSLDVIAQVAKDHAKLARSAQEGHMADKAWLQDMLQQLVSENRRPLRELPEPIGKSVRTILLGRKDPIIIDEPSAEVLRSHEPLKLGDGVEYDMSIEGVFKTNGACRVKILKTNKIVAGKIADPALDKPNNVYTKALNEGGMLHVVAKPTLKGGQIHTLFITQASRIPKPRGRRPKT